MLLFSFLAHSTLFEILRESLVLPPPPFTRPIFLHLYSTPPALSYSPAAPRPFLRSPSPSSPPPHTKTGTEIELVLAVQWQKSLYYNSVSGTQLVPMFRVKTQTKPCQTSCFKRLCLVFCLRVPLLSDQLFAAWRHSITLTFEEYSSNPESGVLVF